MHVATVTGVVFVVAFDFESVKCPNGIPAPLEGLHYVFLLCSSCGLAQEVLVLHVRVLNALYLAGRLWWMSQ